MGLIESFPAVLKNPSFVFGDSGVNEYNASTTKALVNIQFPPTVHIEIEQEVDGRWIAENVDLPGVMVYGNSSQDAIEKVQKLTNEHIKLEHLYGYDGKTMNVQFVLK